MPAPFHISRPPLSRRHVLRGGAALLGLPLLDAMIPTSVRAGGKPAAAAPRRLVAACATLGFHGPLLFPDQPGSDYQPTPYLDLLREHRDRLTVFSGLSHPEQQGNNGHASELTWLTAAQRPGLSGFRNTVSLDQLVAEKIGLETRFPSLALSTSGRSMSWTASGVEIPGETSCARLFKALFLNGTPQEVAAETRQLERGRGILDAVRGEARKLERALGPRDRHKLDEYLAAVGELEARLRQAEDWANRPKPAIDAAPPKDVSDRNDAIAKQRLMYDMIALALRTDSTRVVTFQLSGMNAVPSNIAGVASDWHNLSHHGKDPAKIEELRRIEEAEFAAFNEFLGKLRAAEEHGATLLDHTAVLFGSNLGNASSHDWRNLPIIVAGGGFRHGGYVAHDPQRNTPLANLFVALAQHAGLEIDRFASSTAAGARGLEAT